MPLLAGVTAEEDVASPPTGEISTGEAQRYGVNSSHDPRRGTI